MVKVKPVHLGKNVRMSFNRINEVLEMPNLIEVQKNSYQWFLDQGLKEVFQDVEGLKAVGLTVPQTTELLWQLRQEGLNVPLDALSDEECAAALRDLLA